LSDSTTFGPVSFYDSPPLGIRANIVSAPGGAVGGLRRSDAVGRRFSVLASAREVVKYKKGDGMNFRIENCMRVPRSRFVSIIHHPEFMRASFGGLQTCGSVHICAVCSAKIGERRRGEVMQAVTKWCDRCNSIVMGTFTLQHVADEKLARVAGALNEAYRQMRMRRDWRVFVDRYGFAVEGKPKQLGSITAREYTYGQNGCHPHLHALLFLPGAHSRASVDELQEELDGRWCAALRRVGRYGAPGVRVNCRLSDGSGALADYITKAGGSWTVADELVRGNTKVARRGGRSVAALLEDAVAGDKRSAELFVEYANWTYRKNALVWSPGLREVLGLVDEVLTDEQIAAQQEADGRLMLLLLPDQWLVILGNDLRGEVLFEAASGDVDRVVAFLADLGVEIAPWQLLPQVV